MDQVDITIIGAGVVGLALAQRLASAQCSVAVVEQHATFGQETSSRNSEVIHGGLYYQPQSLKARLCIAGNPLLYAFCQKHGIPHQRIGKLIVATTEAEIPHLKKLMQNGLASGATGLSWLEPEQVAALEPAVRAVAAVLSADTGILDTHRYLHTLAQMAQTQGALITYDAKVAAIDKTAGGFQLTLAKNNFRFASRLVINAAGLSADKVAGLAGLDIAALGYQLYFCKGDYFRTDKKLAVNHLVYPVPGDTVHLGTHLTLDLAGKIRFGPDAEYVNEIHYDVNPNKRERFAESIRHFLPVMQSADLYPDTAGMRPKLQGPKDGFRDFIIQEESGHGLPGLINLIGIESPGLTASLAIADLVAGMIPRDFF